MTSLFGARVRPLAVAVSLAGSLLATRAQAQGWTPPIGIPAPSFGVTEQAGPATIIVQAGGSLPSPIPAGAVVEIRGTYTRNHEGGDAIRCSGTAAQPAFIRGAAGSVLTGTLEVTGSYCILEKLTIRMNTQDSRPTLLLGSGGGDHIVLRDSDIAGNPRGGGVGVVSYSGGTITDIVILRNLIHDHGDVNATTDQDVHGIGIEMGQRIWVLDNEMTRNSGDGLQVNGGQGNSGGIHHVYLGRNTSHGNKQTGLWCKQARDVVFSQNQVYGHRPSGSSSGAGLGGQYNPERVWYLYNRIWDNTVGINMASDLQSGGESHYYVGNVISGIVGTVADGGWGAAALSLWGGTNVTVVGNTFYDVPVGIASPNSKKWTIAQNVIARPRGSHFVLEGAPLSGSTRRNDLYAEAPQASGAPSCTACVTGDPLFVNPAARDFGPRAGSPAIDAGGAEAAVYATFQSLYGIDIRRDAAGSPRPQGNAFDIGALESGGQSNPSDLTIGDVAVTEGNTGATAATFTVSLAPASAQAVSVSFATSNATATAGSDYTPTSGVLSFPAGATTRTLTVPVIGDTAIEGDETFWVDLSGASGATIEDGQGRGTIRDDDAPPPTPSLSVGDVSVNEGQTGTVAAVFNVSLSVASAQPVTLAYATSNGTAQAPSDYTASSGTLTIPAGTLGRTVSVPVLGDTAVEANETFNIDVSSVVGATVVDGRGVGTIVNDDESVPTIGRVLYVDPTLTVASCSTYNVTTRNCAGGTALGYRTIAGAAAATAAGDTVALRGATYAERLVPPRSGTAALPITYRRHASETVTISGASFDPAIDISGRTDLVIDGLRVTDVVGWMRAANSHRNVIRNCTFQRATASGSRAGLKFIDATGNRIEGNTIEDGNDNLLLIHSDRNVVQSNTFRRARHALWTILCGSRNVVRGNSFHNELQKIGQVTDCEGSPSDTPVLSNATKRNLIEANTFAFTPSSGNASPFAGIQYSAQQGIIRRNIFRDTVGPGLDLTLYADEARFNTDNRIFHNVFYKTSFAGVSIAQTSSYTLSGNVIKNNVLYRSQFVANDTRWSWYTGTLSGKPVQVLTGRTSGFFFDRNDIIGTAAGQTYAVTYGRRDSTSNPAGRTLASWQQGSPTLYARNLEVAPGFVNEDLRDFRLAAGSPLVDAAAFLTTTTTAGSGTVLPVADVSYFFDGYGIAGEVGDVIQLQGQTAAARVVSINETSKTLTLDRSVTWTAGQGVSLAFTGTAPDIGAIER